MTAFTPGQNIAMKLPERLFGQTLVFYRDTLGLDVIEIESGAKISFGPMTLWLDRCVDQSQTDLWLELCADDTSSAQAHLAACGVSICNEVEPLPDDVDGFWIAAPSGTIHLVSGQQKENENG